MFKYNINLIENYLASEKISKTEFCRRSGISLYTLNEIYKNSKRINLIYIVKIVKFLSIKLKDFVQF